MNEKVIDELFERCGKQLYSYSNSRTISTGSAEYRDFREKIIAKHKTAIAELEAKVYTYEKIIANSNFKSVLSKDKQALEKRIKELEKILELEGDNGRD